MSATAAARSERLCMRGNVAVRLSPSQPGRSTATLSVVAPSLETVLAPGYLDDVEQLPVDDVRAMRAECVAVETSVSFVRRTGPGSPRHRAGRAAPTGRRRRAPDLGELIGRLPEILGEHARPPGIGRLPQSIEPPEPDPELARAASTPSRAPAELSALPDVDDGRARPRWPRARGVRARRLGPPPRAVRAHRRPPERAHPPLPDGRGVGRVAARRGLTNSASGTLARRERSARDRRRSAVRTSSSSAGATSASSSASSAGSATSRCASSPSMAGISNPYLSQIERGLRKPSAEILQQIAQALADLGRDALRPGRHPRGARRRRRPRRRDPAATRTSPRSRSRRWSRSTSRSAHENDDVAGRHRPAAEANRERRPTR